jgi:hypothetical protein
MFRLGITGNVYIKSSGQGPMADACDNCNEASHFTKGKKNVLTR